VLGSNRTAFAQYLQQQRFPSANLSLYNIHTGEKLTTTYRTPEGEYDADALKAINWILRCHHSNEVANMDIRVLNFLNMVDNQLGGDNEIHIISGFRSLELKERRLILSFHLLIFPQCEKRHWHSARGESATIPKPGSSISIPENCAPGKEQLRKVAFHTLLGGAIQ